jgi:type I restriction enzyme R subunit
VTPTPSPNFAYLAHHDARLVALATQAEEHFAGDPTVTLFKLRQFGEVLAQRAAAKVGLFLTTEEGQQQLIDRLWERNVIGATQRSLFHDLRRMGNAAVHEGTRLETRALFALRRDGLTDAAIGTLYPYLTEAQLSQSLDLEEQLEANLAVRVAA